MVSGRILRWYGEIWALAASVSTLLALIGIGAALVKLTRLLERLWSWFLCGFLLALKCVLGKTVECGENECPEAPGGIPSWLGLLLTSLLVCVARVMQLVVYPAGGRSFAKMEYYVLFCCYCFLVLLDILRVIYWTDFDLNIFEHITIYASPIYNFVLCALEIYLGDRFRQHMRDMMVTQAAEYFVTAHSVFQISADTEPRILPRLRRILAWFMRPQPVYVSLPDDQGLETVAASPDYRAEIGREPPVPFAEHFQYTPLLPIRIYFGGGGRWDVPPYDEWDSKVFIDHLLGVPLETVLARRKLISRRSGGETIVPPELRRITLIVHGVHKVEQADELYETIERLKNFYPWIGVVVITEPQLLLRLSHSHVIMENLWTLYVAHGSAGSIIYSGRYPSPPMFYESLFLLLLDGIPCDRDEPQSTLADVALLFDEPTYADETTSFTASIFLHLYKMFQSQLLYKFQVASHARINKRLVKDNAKIAEMLQWLFERNSYKADIPFLPREHVLAVMNLTSHITQHGASINSSTNDFEAQSSIWHFLSWLSVYMDQLPADAIVHGAVLLSDHPVKHGGFSDVYHARYRDPDGKPVEVALKVLKVFEHQTGRNQHALHQTFMREALVWHSLKHPNIVPLIGIDSTTFSPSRALVSLWMPLGSVLAYMRENSPSSPYAGDLLNDVIQGLTYLHDLDIVHGDLCGRNILINKYGRACLSDFGLAGFIQLDHSIKSPTRGGSTRWMAPELLAPTPNHPFRRTRESDVWAFGCVCCEIWSEGKLPFSHILTDMGIILTISESAAVLSQESPYPTRPYDKGGKLMPDSLWNLAQQCFQYEPSERPDGHLMAGMIGDIRSHSVQPVSGNLVERESMPSGSSAGRSNWQIGTQAIRLDEAHHLTVEELEMNTANVTRWGPLKYQLRAEEMTQWATILNFCEIAQRDGWLFVSCSPTCFPPAVMDSLDWSVPITTEQLQLQRLESLAEIFEPRQNTGLKHLMCFHLHAAHWTIFHYDLTVQPTKIEHLNSLGRPDGYQVSPTEDDLGFSIEDQVLLSIYLHSSRLPGRDPNQKVPQIDSKDKKFTQRHLNLQRSDSTTCGFWAVFVAFSMLLGFDLDQDLVRGMDRTPADLKEVLASIYSAFRADEIGVPLDLVQTLFQKFGPTFDYSSLTEAWFSVRPQTIARAEITTSNDVGTVTSRGELTL
ncbi:hypothetical protein C8R45DRAFT_1114611 [Mycena sanguinolenta]|nr:hypothetical protein C8R45DRAFT_1114611 [Mycena sanguinolenta]